MDAPAASSAFRHAALLAFLLAVAALVAAALLGRAGFLLDPVRAQVEGRPGASYSPNSLAAWAVLGGLGVLAYAQEARHMPLLRPSPRTLGAMIPALAFGPLFHALLGVGLLPASLGWLAAEPLVYVTVAALVLAAGAGGALSWPADRERGRDRWILFAGSLALLAALVVAAPRFGPHAVYALAIAAAAGAYGFAAWGVGRAAARPGYEDLARPFAIAIYFGHALDGLTTWIGVRDPFAWGLGGYAEKNPFSETLLVLGNGWPFLAVKLVLPAVILFALRDIRDELHKRLALLAVFALGFGPGAANALQMALRGG